MTNDRSPASGFRFVDLFAGVGGFHHALAPLGGECVLAVEADAACRRVYSEAFPEMPLNRMKTDVRALTRESPHPNARELSPYEIRRLVPAHDVLCAGFPCQPFSKSGLQMGVRDKTRGTLFFDVMSIVLARRPEFVILENVRNLAGPRHADTWATIVESFREAGYEIEDDPVILSPHSLAPWDGGAPQIRDRVFLLARRSSKRARRVRPRHDVASLSTHHCRWDPHRWDITDFLDSDVSMATYGLRDIERGWLDAWREFVKEIDDESLPGFPLWVDAFRDRPLIPAGTPQWKADFLRKNSDFYNRNQRVIERWNRSRWGPLKQRVEEFPTSRRKFEWQARRAQPTAKDRDLDQLVAHLRPSGIRVKPATYLPALVAITQTSILGPAVTGTDWRRLTPREAARLQGIPFDCFQRAGMSDKTIYRQLGNAVNVGVVQYLATRFFVDSCAIWACESTHQIKSKSIAE